MVTRVPNGGAGYPAGFAGIDPQAMTDVIKGLNRAKQDLGDYATKLAGVLYNVGADASSVTRTFHSVESWIDGQLPHLRRRIELARADPNWDGAGHAGSLAMVSDSAAAVTDHQAAGKGAHLAGRIWDESNSSDGVSPELINQLKQAATDPAFAAGFWHHLGAKRSAELIRRLAAQRKGWTDGGVGGAKLRGLENNQQQLLHRLDISLAAATHAKGTAQLDPGFARSLAEADPQAAGQLVRWGHFDKDFLNGLAPVIYNWESAYPKKSDFAPRINDPEIGNGDGHAGDPMVSVLWALSRNTAAAQQFFTPERLRKLYGGGSRDGHGLDLADGGTSLGAFITAATTNVRDHSAAGKRSAEDAYLAVHIAAGLGHVPPEVKPALGTLLGSYIDDVALAEGDTNADDSGDFTHDGHVRVDRTTMPDGPYGAHFSIHDLHVLLPQVEGDPQAFRTLRAGAQAYARGALQQAIERHRWSTYSRRVGELYGLLASSHNLSEIDKGTARDNARSDLLGDLRAVADTAITVGTAAGGITIAGSPWAGLTQGQLENWIQKNLQTHHGDTAKLNADDFDTKMRDELSNVATSAIVGSHKAEGHGWQNLDFHDSPQHWFRREYRHDDSRKDAPEPFFRHDGSIIPAKDMSPAQLSAFCKYINDEAGQKSWFDLNQVQNGYDETSGSHRG